MGMMLLSWRRGAMMIGAMINVGLGILALSLWSVLFVGWVRQGLERVRGRVGVASCTVVQLGGVRVCAWGYAGNRRPAGLVVRMEVGR